MCEYANLIILNINLNSISSKYLKDNTARLYSNFLIVEPNNQSLLYTTNDNVKKDWNAIVYIEVHFLVSKLCDTSK